MPDYVYALHDFLPEHEDEVTFHAGERIEVVERDDQYGDGWWQGKNVAGKTGLFPQSYTTPDPPAAAAPAAAPTLAPKMPSVSEEPDSPPHILVNGENPSSPITDEPEEINGEVMKATMTDVQKAIEQLGRTRNGEVDTDDGARSMDFSFASSKDEDGETDTDFDASDADGEDWHKGARQKLAEKARQAVQEAEKMEEIMKSPSGSRLVAPPIEVEMSDESEGEDDDHVRSPFSRISEADEDEFEEQNTTINGSQNSTVNGSDEGAHVIVPPRDESEALTATAVSFPESPPEEPPAPAPAPAVIQPVMATPLTPISPVAPPPLSPALVIDSKHSSLSTKSAGPLSPLSQAHSVETTHPTEWSEAEVVDWLKSKGFGQDVCDKFAEQEITGDVLLELDVNLLKSEIGILPFGKRMRIANAITDLRRPPSIVYSETQAKHPQIPQPLTPSQTNSQHSHSRNLSFGYAPSWQGSVVYAGLPAGLVSPESAPHTGDLPVMPTPDLSGAGTVDGSDSGSQGYSRTHSRSQSQSLSFAAVSMPGEDGIAPGTGLGLGLGDVSAKTLKTRPAQLTLSPSDGALSATAKAVSDIPEEVETEDRGAVSENEAMAPANTIRRRLFGRSHDSGPSRRDSAASGGSGSAVGSSPGYLSSPSKEKDVKEKDKDAVSTSGSSHHRPRKSVDVNNTKPTERMSIFGGFGGTIGIGGKGRKPVPRYSAAGVDDSGLMTTSEKNGTHSTLNLGRLYGSKKGHGARPSTSDGISSHDTIKSRKGGAAATLMETPPISPRSHKETHKETKDPALLRKRTTSTPGLAPSSKADSKSNHPNGLTNLKAGQSILSQIGEPDHVGWMRKKGDRYNAWKLRYFVLKGSHMYCLKSNNPTETRIKGYINIVGYKVVVDENVDPGRYGFKIVHDNDKPHFFSSEEKAIVRDWMKAIMKATIGRDYTKPVVSSCNIPTIPLMVAQAMNPAPRPPSPTARDATQKALRREHPDQLSSRDARVLMGLPSTENKDGDRNTAFPEGFEDVTIPPPAPTPRSPAPPRPSREGRPSSTSIQPPQSPAKYNTPIDDALIEWANSHLPSTLQVADANGPVYGGLAILRLAESIKGRPTSPPVLDSAFPSSPNDDKLDGLFRLFDFLLDNDVKMGSVSINDIRTGKRDKVVQLLRALKAWEDKRTVIAQSIGNGSVQAGAFMAPVSSSWS